MWTDPYVTYKVAQEIMLDFRLRAERERLARTSRGRKQARLDPVIAGVLISFFLVVVLVWQRSYR